jgi:hypothetical protein
VRNNGDWQTLYYDTVVELDPIKLLDKIEAAQKAIADRLKNAMNPINANEQQVIENARRNLYFLKKHPAAWHSVKWVRRKSTSSLLRPLWTQKRRCHR